MIKTLKPVKAVFHELDMAAMPIMGHPAIYSDSPDSSPDTSPSSKVSPQSPNSKASRHSPGSSALSRSSHQSNRILPTHAQSDVADTMRAPEWLSEMASRARMRADNEKEKKLSLDPETAMDTSRRRTISKGEKEKEFQSEEKKAQSEAASAPPVVHELVRSSFFVFVSLYRTLSPLLYPRLLVNPFLISIQCLFLTGAFILSSESRFPGGIAC